MNTELPQFNSSQEFGGVFLGRYTYGTLNYDLWHCPQFSDGVTVVARFGNDGCDYMSGMCFGWMDDQPAHPLVIARQRAEERGLNVEREIYAGKMKRGRGGIIYYSEE